MDEVIDALGLAGEVGRGLTDADPGLGLARQTLGDDLGGAPRDRVDESLRGRDREVLTHVPLDGHDASTGYEPVIAKVSRPASGKKPSSAYACARTANKQTHLH